jgi:alpha-tubulin suppressor-like RCC1 family protein
MLKLGQVLGLLLLAACGGSPSPTPPPPGPTGNNIDPSVSAPLANNLQQAAAESGSQSSVIAQGATLALQAGVQSSGVNITAAPTPPPHSAVPTKSGTVTTGGAQAYAFQLTLLHVPQGPSTQVFSGVLVFTDAADAALAAGPSPGSPIPPGVGLILTGGNALWTASAGQVSAQVGQVLSASCPHASLLPAFVTACTLNDFSNAGFAISASTPSSSYATGSKTVSLPAGALVGAALTVDCSQTSLCGTSTGSLGISLYSPSQTVQVDGTLQFTATVTGTTNTAVTWTVLPASGGGTISSSGLYTAPSSPGTYQVVATSVADTSVSARTSVTVTSGPVVSVSITPAVATVAPGGTQPFTATVGGTSNTQVNWSVEEGTTGGGVSTSGLYTAPGTSGTYHVVATSQADTTKSAVATVTVAVPSVPWAMVSAGSDNSMGLRTDGSLWTWGGNYAGELGNGAALGTFQTSPITLGNGYAFVTSGYTFDFAITTGHMLYAWGRNTYGQLGTGNLTDANVPTAVGAGFASAAGGYFHSAGIKTDGTLWAWGDNTYGELGDGTTTSTTSPVQVGTDTNWASVSAGYFYTMALKTDGTLWAWGWNIYGQTGNGASSGNQLTPLQIGTGYASVSATWFTSYAVKTDGTLWGWGDNLAGGLGSAPSSPGYFTTPMQIGTGYGYGTGLTQSSTGFGLKTDGSVWASGDNTNGTFGNGTTTSNTAFTQTLSGFQSIRVGGYYVLGLKSDGSLWAWGDNTYGELGIGSTATRSTSPVNVP